MFELMYQQMQIAIAERIIQDGLNVRQTEAIVQNYGSEKTRPQKKDRKPDDAKIL